METIGYLCNAQFGCVQQERGFHEKHLVDVIYNGSTGYLTNDAREIDGRDVELGCIEGNVVMLGKMVG